MELSDFIGKTFDLTGCDVFPTLPKEFDELKGDGSSCIIFTLDDVNYAVIEDESDGYRSSMKEIKIVRSVPVKNIFEACRVTCRDTSSSHNSSAGSLVQFVDVDTNEVVLEVGTNNDDDYYPSFVSRFNPKAMSANTLGTLRKLAHEALVGSYDDFASWS